MATTDWRTLADAACGRATDAQVARGWGSTMRDQRRHLPGVAGDVRAGIVEIRRLPGRPDQRFVADMEALGPRYDELARASRTMKVRLMDRAIARLEPALRTAGASARQAGLEQCLQHDIPRTIVNGLRAPVASEQLALIFKRTDPRLDAAEETAKSAATHVQGLRDYAAALADREAAVRAMRVPRWASRERAGYLDALHAHRAGVAELADLHAAGVDTPDAQIAALVTRPEKLMNRRCEKLWDGLGARPTTKL